MQRNRNGRARTRTSNRRNLWRDPNKKSGRVIADEITREQTFWSEQLGADVKLRYSKTGKVRITITVTSLDEYQGIRERLRVS